MSLDEEQIILKDKFFKKVQEYEVLYDLVFTTFNFSPGFFEDCIICKLSDGEKIRYPRDIQSCNNWLVNKNVIVFYDSKRVYLYKFLCNAAYIVNRFC